MTLESKLYGKQSIKGARSIKKKGDFKMRMNKNDGKKYDKIMMVCSLLSVMFCFVSAVCGVVMLFFGFIQIVLAVLAI